MTEQLIQRVLEEARVAFGAGLPVSIMSRRDIDCPYSTVSRLELKCGGSSRAVYVKRLKAASVQRDVAERRVITEYQTLARLRSHFAGDLRLGVANPVAMFPEELTIVTEEVAGTPLMDLIGHFAKRHLFGSRLAYLEENCRLAGAWLQHFQALYEKGTRAFDVEALIRYCEQRLDMMIQCGAPGIDAKLKNAFTAFLERMGREIGPVRLVGCHNDYSPHNIIVGHERLNVIDFAFFDYECDAYDVGRFWSQLESLKSSPFFSPSAIERLQGAFFEGYGGDLLKNSALFELVLCRYNLTRAATMVGEGMRSGVRGWIDSRSYWQCVRWLTRHCDGQVHLGGKSRSQAAVQQAT